MINNKKYLEHSSNWGVFGLVIVQLMSVKKAINAQLGFQPQQKMYDKMT